MTLTSFFAIVVIALQNGILYLFGKLLKQSKEVKKFLGVESTSDVSEEESVFQVERILYLMGFLMQILAIVNILIQTIAVLYVMRS